MRLVTPPLFTHFLNCIIFHLVSPRTKYNDPRILYFFFSKFSISRNIKKCKNALFYVYLLYSRGTIFYGVRARLRKVASSAFLYKKLISARWWHIPNPLEQAKRLATQFLRIALFCCWIFLQK